MTGWVSKLSNAVTICFLGGFVVSSCSLSPSGEGVSGRLKGVFPEAETVQQIELPASCPEAVIAAWTIGSLSESAGYGLRIRGDTRSGYFVALLVLSQELEIKDLEVEKYIGERGGEIRRGKFRNQFVGKTMSDSLRTGDDIDAVTGATISSDALTNTVRESVRWLDSFLRKRSASSP